MVILTEATYGQSYEINGIKFEVFDGGIRREDFNEYQD